MPDITLCPNCAAPVQTGWKVCPLCTHALGRQPLTAIRTDAERTPGSSVMRKKHRWDEPIPATVPNIEKDVKTDNTVTGAVLLALGFLGTVGIFLYVSNSRSAEISIYGIIGVAIAVIVVLMVGSVLATQHSRPGVTTAVGIFSSLTTGCLIAIIVVMVALASILHFLALTCNVH